MSDMEEPYRSRLSDLMGYVLRSGVPPKLEALLPYLRGAPPDVVWPLLKKQSLEYVTDVLKTLPKTVQETTLDAGYEPHPLDFDWQFTPETAGGLANFAVLSGDSIALFGMPSVHAAIAQAGRQSILIDWNPLAILRHPGSAYRFDLCQDYLPWKNRFDLVLIDAPWYPELLFAWLERAFFVTKACGTVAFSLWGELTRPEALQEREHVLDVVALCGHITIERDALSYVSPLFERIAFTAADIPAPSSWRRGDLVIVRKCTSAVPPRAPELHEVARWHRFAFGRRQVAVRDVSNGAESGLKPIGCPSYLTTVSRRHAVRKSVDVWLSNNQVVSLGTTKPILGSFYALANGTGSFSDAVDVALIEQLRLPMGINGVPRPWRHQEWMTHH